MDKLRNDIIKKMRGTLNDEQIKTLGAVLDLVLYDYEVTEKSRELATTGATNWVILKNYLGTRAGEGLSATTLKAYKYEISRLFTEIDKPVTEITTNDIRYLLARYQVERNTSTKTLNNMRTYYNAFFKWLVQEEIITSNPIDRIKPIKAPKTHKKPFTEKEIERLLDACETTRDRAIIEFLYSTGCRASECINADLSDIDFRRNTFNIRNGKGNKDRTVFISERAMLWLERYISERKDADTALWIGRKGRLSRHGLGALVRRLGEKAGVQGAHPHKFRHTLASDMIKRDAPLQVVQQILGHESLDTTMEYVTIMDGEAERVYKKLIA